MARGGVLGGRKIELVIEDDSGTPEKGVAGLRKLASQDKVSAVIGQFHSSVMEAVQDLAEQLKIPVFSTQASAKRITEKHLNYTFRTHVIDPDRVQMWNRFIQQQGFKRVAIIAENTDYGIGLVRRDQEAIRVERHQGASSSRSSSTAPSSTSPRSSSRSRAGSPTSSSTWAWARRRT